MIGVAGSSGTAGSCQFVFPIFFLLLLSEFLHLLGESLEQAAGSSVESPVNSKHVFSRHSEECFTAGLGPRCCCLFVILWAPDFHFSVSFFNSCNAVISSAEGLDEHSVRTHDAPHDAGKVVQPESQSVSEINSYLIGKK